MGEVIDRITDVFKKELDLCDNDTDILRYSLAVYSTTVIGYAAIILAAWPFGVVGLALVSVISASVFRMFSGGAHASNSRN
ncbi:MAG TPA: accessory gene regulator B family protein, partial [Desulfobacteria bacterium]|nr:accessory gene regulator B family protein [Desulfobacteria bacterium]